MNNKHKNPLTKYISVLLIFAIMLAQIFCLSGCQKPQTQPIKYDISVTLNEAENKIEGSLQVEFEGSNREMEYFFLQPNGYNKDNLKNMIIDSKMEYVCCKDDSFGQILIVKVKDKIGKLDYDVSSDGRVLSVHLGRRRGRIKLIIDFVTLLPKMNGIFGVGDSYISAYCFYPVYVQNLSDIHSYNPYTDCAKYTLADFLVKIRYPKSMVIGAPGYLEDRTEEGEELVDTYSLAGGRVFSAVFSREYSVTKITTPSGEVTYLDLNPGGEERAKQIADCIGFFNETIGKREFNLTVAEGVLASEGVCFSGLIMVDKNLSTDTFTHTVIHEVVHNWWYDGVYIDGFTSSYILEGITEYYVYKYLKSTEGFAGNWREEVEGKERAFSEYRKIIKEVYGDKVKGIKRSSEEFLGVVDYVRCCYDGGLSMFNALEEAVGEKRLLSSLKKLYEDNLGGSVDKEQLINSFGVRKRQAGSIIDWFSDEC